LTLTAEGLAVQPMMSLLVLENIGEHGDAALVESLGRGTLAALQHEFRALVREIGGWRPAFLMRFGFAPAPSGRTGRLPLHAVAQYATTPMHCLSKVQHESWHDGFRLGCLLRDRAQEQVL
jgi:hypothetical protein